MWSFYPLVNDMSIYQFNDDMLPDSDFEPGEYEHLVIEKHGRLLDPRRTPVRIVDLRPSVGMFVIRIEAFEDKGALWEVPYEEVSHYQFVKGKDRATPGIVSEFRRAVDRFDRPLRISCDQDARAETLTRIGELCKEVSGWFDDHSRFFHDRRDLPDPEVRKGDPVLWTDLNAFLATRGLREMEEAFARQFASNPYSGELVKGHRIVLADLGLVAYEGKVTRDAELFDGKWSRGRRADHILSRMAFVHSLFQRLGYSHRILYRGISCPGPLQLPDNTTFVSATFSMAVAKSHFDSGGEESTRVLYQQAVPIERLFMTYYETEQMNLHFREAEAVLLYDANNMTF